MRCLISLSKVPSNVVNVVGSKDDSSRWKPDNLLDHLTAGEVGMKVGRTKTRILQLERAGVFPKPIMVKVGRLRVRLYSPEEVAKIDEHFKNARAGRASENYGKLKNRR